MDFDFTSFLDVRLLSFNLISLYSLCRVCSIDTLYKYTSFKEHIFSNFIHCKPCMINI
nr:MAG TPA: hypothetical protein [Caudoviricetes sp.]